MRLLREIVIVAGLVALVLTGAWLAPAAELNFLDYDTRMPCVADGKEHLITGYSILEGVSWQIQAVALTPSQPAPVTVQIRTASFVPDEVPYNTILAEVSSDNGKTVIRGANIEWPATVSTGVYCTATGGGVQQIKVRVYYYVNGVYP